MTAQGKASRRATPWVNRPEIPSPERATTKPAHRNGQSQIKIVPPFQGLNHWLAFLNPGRRSVSLRLPWAVMFRAFSPRVRTLLAKNVEEPFLGWTVFVPPPWYAPSGIMGLTIHEFRRRHCPAAVARHGAVAKFQENLSGHIRLHPGKSGHRKIRAMKDIASQRSDFAITTRSAIAPFVPSCGQKFRSPFSDLPAPFLEDARDNAFNAFNTFNGNNAKNLRARTWHLLVLLFRVPWSCGPSSVLICVHSRLKIQSKSDLIQVNPSKSDPNKISQNENLALSFPPRA